MSLRSIWSVILLTTTTIASSFVRADNHTTELIPAFPGAEGHARYTTTGGRDGEVYHVTNLNDSGPGSLRDAVSGSNRTIVFDVGGYIDLESNLLIEGDSLTIAGQTAPGEGITIRYYTVRVTGNNIIMRFIRIRRSQLRNVNDGADATWGRQLNNVILDHCSFSWSIDEIASYYDNKNFTMQWCVLGEALANPGHTKGQHSYGGIWGGKGASFHHNFLLHMQNRAPRFNGARYNYTGNLDPEYENCLQAERVDFRNCVMYNWGTGGCYGGPGGGYVNMVNNYYKAGPGTSNKTCVTSVMVARKSNIGKDLTYLNYASRYYVNGNYVSAASMPENYDWQGVTYESGLERIGDDMYIPDSMHYYGNSVQYMKDKSGRDCVRLKLDKPVPYGEVTTHKAEVAYEKVLKYAGASLHRDSIDERYEREARGGFVSYMGRKAKRAGIVDSINALNGVQAKTRPSFPTLPTVSRHSRFDTDGDGIPDEWEKAHGLNRRNAKDGAMRTLDPRGWYTNLELYMNSLVEDIMRRENADAVERVREYYPDLLNGKRKRRFLAR